MNTLPTQPTLFQRVRRFFRLVELKRQLSGAHADLQDASTRIDLLEAAQFSSISAEAKREAFTQREMARVELLACFKRLDTLNQEIHRLEQGGF